MIAETEVLSTSPWGNDGLLKDLPSSDYIKSFISDNLEFGIPTVDVETNRYRRPEFSSSCSHSSSSSQYSEDFSLDITCRSNDTSSHISDHDYPSTTLNLLDDNSMPFYTEDFDSWTDENFVSFGSDILLPYPLMTENECEEVETMVASCPSSPKSKTTKITDPLADNTSWSSMSVNDQRIAIEYLTNIISNELGLREQLDIIRIIQPTAKVSPTDTEFVIDLNLLNDHKLCFVRDYLRKAQGNRRSEKKGSSKHNTHHYNNQPSWKSGCSSNGVSTSKSEGTKNKSTKAHKEKERRKAANHRNRKEHRQILKERRSGLFVREEVLSLSTEMMMIDEDSDIDILG